MLASEIPLKKRFSKYFTNAFSVILFNLIVVFFRKKKNKNKHLFILNKARKI